MSLITRCPACETLFKVVPDQLRISEGWVRCGQCDEIFDASLHLLPSEAAQSPHAGPLEGAAAFSATDTPASTPAQPLDIDLDAMNPGKVDELPEDAQDAEPIELEEPALPAEAPDLPEPMSPSPSPAPESTDLVMASIARGGPEHDPGSAVHQASFLRDRKTRSHAPGPFMRAALVFLCLTLLFGLLGQVVIHERDRIAAFEPGFKPWLLALCRPLNCAVSPLKRIDAIVIDSASFTKIRGGAFHLNMTLKNTAVTALAVPAVELTLTDALDQTVIRRVFLARELDGKSDTLAAGSEWSTSLAMAVKGGGAADRVAGYRLVAFYP